MAPTHKSPEVSHVHVDENGYEDVHELETVYKTGEADRRDMLRMNKPQEMKVMYMALRLVAQQADPSLEEFPMGLNLRLQRCAHGFVGGHIEYCNSGSR